MHFRHFHLFLHYFVDGRLILIDISAAKLLTVDEDSRNPPDTDIEALLVIITYQFADGGIIDVLVKLIHFQTEFLRNLYDFIFINLFVNFEKLIMKFPELALSLGSQRCDGRCGSKFVTAKRKVFKNNGYRIRVFFEHLLEQRRKPRTVGSLKIAEHGNDHLGIFIALPWRAYCFDFMDKTQFDDFKRLIIAA